LAMNGDCFVVHLSSVTKFAAENSHLGLYAVK